ncbi:MAG: DUF1269 domain-containing protein [Gammaproteobacteria bacterium]
MSKLYFLVPDSSTAENIVGDLKSAGIDEADIGVVAKSDAMTDALPEAGIEKTSDVKPALKDGMAVGAATGVLAGLAATVVSGGLAIGGTAYFAMVVGGSAFGAWASSLIGVSVPNREVQEFQDAIDAGRLLMIVSATTLPDEIIRSVVETHHPDVKYGGQEDAVRNVA